MEITPKFVFTEGSFDTLSTEMTCVASKKYGEVDLCIKADGWNITIAKIKLHGRDYQKDADAVFEDAEKLGDEIARRWNECQNKK